MQVEPLVSCLNLGKAAEHLVVADLIMQGHQAFLSDQGLPYDVIVDAGGRLLKVQVKATAAPSRRVSRLDLNILGYHFHIKRCGKHGSRQYAADDFDVIALVAMDIRAIGYMTADEGVKKSIILRPPNYPLSNAISRKEDIGQLPFGRVLERLGLCK